MDLISAVGVFAASLGVGRLKSWTTALDGRVGAAIKPVTPLVVAAAGIGLPYLTEALGLAPVDPSVFVTAPTATVVAVTAHELAKRIRPVDPVRPSS